MGGFVYGFRFWGARHSTDSCVEQAAILPQFHKTGAKAEVKEQWAAAFCDLAGKCACGLRY